MDAKVLRFLGTAFLLLRGQSALEEAHILADKPKTASEGMQLPMAIRVLLADDSEVVRKAIKRLLLDDPEIQLVAEAASFSQTMQLTNELQPHVVVMDLHMGREHVTPAQVKSSLARARLLAICIWNDEETRALAESFGAAALLNKGNLTAELIPTIKQHGRPTHA